MQSPIVTRILQQARARRNASDIPGFEAAFGTRRAPGVTQDQTAQLAGVSRRWYGSLEAGRPANYSDAFLHAVRRILDLNDDEWDIVYRVTRGHAPAAAPVSHLGALLPDAFRAFIEESRTWAVYLSDHRWDVLAYNAKTLEYFPWMQYGLNVMEWALTWPEARTQLVNWEEEWAMPMMAQLRVNAEQWRTDERLRAVIATVRADPVARKLWDSPDLPTITHPASERPRRLYLAGQGGQEYSVRFIAGAPLELPSYRLMVVTPATPVSSD
ncbi:helix-turn-helix transcriptional regulator [Streptomyces sp. NBC_00554]|uniref:helix-turn-helix domain-containing protein n=1 Tax=Streptomyces sp. NBC_00554 TaxID=2903661 RepID=UPI00352F752D|nr:helix-turn-helix transcriptional regulator [Streptomyces sp. NBC_00554]